MSLLPHVPASLHLFLHVALCSTFPQGYKANSSPCALNSVSSHLLKDVPLLSSISPSHWVVPFAYKHELASPLTIFLDPMVITSYHFISPLCYSEIKIKKSKLAVFTFSSPSLSRTLSNQAQFHPLL